MPRVVNPVTVVELPGKVAINELFGGASCAPCGSALGPDISLAHVKAKAGFAEDWQAPAFDEYVLVLKGSVTIEHAHGPPAVVAAGCGVYLAKGERAWLLMLLRENKSLVTWKAAVNIYGVCYKLEWNQPKHRHLLF
jgi:hypothetical protein